MVPLMMPLALLVVSHDQKSHTTYQFGCLYLGKGVVPFLVQLASCDTDTDPNHIM